MRKIKFRAKAKFSGTLGSAKWIYSSLMRLDAPTHRLNLGGLDCDIDTLGQFTGLHDKNGKEIYEGDRVRVSHGGRHYWLFEIKALGGQFGNNLYGVCYEHNLSTNEDDSTYTYEKVTGNFYRSECVGGKYSEVIGNIHENPELLNAD